MKYCTIRLVDACTGELIYETKSIQTASLPYLRSRLQKNLDSFCNYFRDNSYRDVVFQAIIHEEKKSLSLYPSEDYIF